MKTVRNAILLLWGVLICYPVGMKAQDKFDASVGMDLVSGYIWRGQDLGNVSIQPEVSLAYKGFSLTGWGTVGFDKDDIKEFDLTLGYEVKGFSCSVTDYWTNGGPGTSTMGHIIRVIHLKRRLDMTLASYRWTGLRTLLEISVIKQMEVKLMLPIFQFLFLLFWED